ncbi:methyltransferase domain-containing protein [Parahaliea mediterranea]|uniref:Methyltransferase domain-containing protein n=1 Tax=Parahaliea mediterranea TaxID=651086 RepID=A0A939DBZ5_9GAMM|nr:methyltransferase domain-containing protein [Parahaliea mediterranea]MBN7795265.1 methyltransferase domain-containing protein [Parahaliea mediterranea]
MDHSSNNKDQSRAQIVPAMRWQRTPAGPKAAVSKLLEAIVLPENGLAANAMDARRLRFSREDSGQSSSIRINEFGEAGYLLERFLTEHETHTGLRLQFNPLSDPVFAEHWVNVDLSVVERKAREAGSISLDFEDDCFDLVLCTGLDQISRPNSLAKELRRVLKRRGQLWAQAPLSRPDMPDDTSGQPRYWYFTPRGFQILFEDFDEIICSIYQTSAGDSRCDSFFYGIKPEIA